MSVERRLTPHPTQTQHFWSRWALRFARRFVTTRGFLLKKKEVFGIIQEKRNNGVMKKFICDDFNHGYDIGFVIIIPKDTMKKGRFERKDIISLLMNDKKLPSKLILYELAEWRSFLFLNSDIQKTFQNYRPEWIGGFFFTKFTMKCKNVLTALLWRHILSLD